MSEVWKQIDGFDGNYDVSSLGRVRSWKAKGSWSRSDRAFILKPVNGAYGYKFVSPGHRGKIKQFAIHRLVAGAFHPNPLVLSQVNHIDNNRENNAAVNLEWCDHRANMRHALLQGRLGRKLSAETVMNIRKHSALKLLNRKEIALFHDVSVGSVNDVVNGRYWQHV